MINTSAPAMIPPEGSRTMPLTVPFGDCAVTVFMNKTNVRKHRTVTLIRTRHLLEGKCLHFLFSFSQEQPQSYQRVPVKGANGNLSSGDGPACYGWFGFTFR